MFDDAKLYRAPHVMPAFSSSLRDGGFETPTPIDATVWSRITPVYLMDWAGWKGFWALCCHVGGTNRGALYQTCRRPGHVHVLDMLRPQPRLT